MRPQKKLTGRLDISNYLLYILVVFYCTFFIYKDFGIRMMTGYVVMVAILAIQILCCLLRRKAPLLTPIEGAFCLIVLTVCISFCRPDTNRTSDLTAYIIAMLICCAYLIFSDPDEDQLKILSQVAIAGAVGFSVFVLLTSAFDSLFWNIYYPALSDASKAYADKYIPNGYSPTLGGSCTYTDYVIVIGLSFVFGKLLAGENNRKRAAVLWGLALLFTGSVAVVGRRGELLGILVAMVFLWILMGRGKGVWLRLGYLFGGMLTALGLFMLFLPQLKQVSFLSRYVMTIEKLLTGQDITSGRLELYQLALALFIKKPIFGIGWGRFSDYVPEAFKAVHGADVANVHNIYLEFLCEVGITGAILIIIPMVYLMVHTVKQFMRLRSVSAQTGKTRLALQLNTASLMIQTFFLFVGFLDPCFSKLIFWAMYALAAKLLSCALRLEGYTINDFLVKTWRRAISKLPKRTVRMKHETSDKEN